jgi:hypothetical protein
MEEYPTFAETMLFDANLREFTNRVGIICALEAGHKLSPQDAYSRVKKLWKALKRSQHNLHMRAPDTTS